MSKVHHYHPETGLYTGTSDARPDPLDGNYWLCPASATFEEPPTPGQGQGVRRVLDRWELFDFPPAPAPAPAPSPDALRAAAIAARLQAIDEQSARPLREVIKAQASGQPVPAFAVAKLGKLEDEANALRVELKGLKP